MNPGGGRPVHRGVALPRTPFAIAVGALAFGAFALVEVRTNPGAVETAFRGPDGDGDGDAPRAPAELDATRGADLAPCPVGRRDPRPTAPAETASPAPPSSAPPPELAPLGVVFVDAVSGQPIAGCEPLAPGAAAEGRTEKLPAPRWTPTGAGAAEGRVRRAADGVTEYAIPAPWFAWASLSASALSDRATSFRLVRPLHREVDVRLRLLDADGRPCPDARLVRWSVARVATPAPRVEGFGGGVLRLRDVPWLPGESIELRFESDPGRAGAEECADPPPEVEWIADYEPSESWIEVDPAEETSDVDVPAAGSGPGECTILLPMPASPYEALVEDVRLRFVAPPALTIRRGGASFRTSCGCCRGERADEPRGRVRVRLVDAHGAPLVGVRVRVARSNAVTGADGVARMDGVRAGRCSISVLDRGYRFPTREVDVVADDEVSVEVSEAPSATLVVLVVGEDDRPVPSASIELKPQRFGWFDVDERGVQRLDPFTDAYGRRDCHDVPCGPAKVAARFGGRTGEAEVLVGEDGRSVVRIVVK